jgi:hypothetical protein
MDVEQPFDVAPVARAARESFHDHQILDGRNASSDGAKLDG